MILSPTVFCLWRTVVRAPGTLRDSRARPLLFPPREPRLPVPLLPSIHKLLEISCPSCLSSFLAQSCWPCLSLPLGKPVTSVWPSCSGPGMLRLQATMHFHMEGTRMRNGAGYRWFGLGVGGPSGVWGSSCLLPTSDLLLHSPGAHCPLFLRDTNYSLVGS